nr:MAG TPA: hypothetical protein [Caudoviricetes sp.]
MKDGRKTGVATQTNFCTEVSRRRVTAAPEPGGRL